MIKVSSTTKKISFEITLPQAQSVAVVGDFNGWNSDTHPMKRSKNGVWKVTAEIPAGEYQFRYLVDSSRWYNDSDTPSKANEFGSENSVLTVKFPGKNAAMKKAPAKKASRNGKSKK